MFFKKKEMNSFGSGHFEPDLEVTFLPRCVNCEKSHPLARKPVPADTSKCPDCGHPTYHGKTQHVPAVLSGKGLQFARVLFDVGKYLRNLTNRE